MTTDEAILAELRRQTPWIRFLGLQALKPVLGGVLKSDKHKLAYELTDGQRTTRQVSEGAGVGAATVSRWWSEWLAIGVCTEEIAIAGRARHLAPLGSLGIDVPSPGAPASHEPTKEDA